MSLIAEFRPTAASRSAKQRLEKAAQHIEVRRWAPSPFCIYNLGLVAGIPELFSLETTHPVRQRVRAASGVPTSHAAYFAQHGRGPIAEKVSATQRAGVLVGEAGGNVFDEPTLRLPEGVDVSNMYYSCFKLYLNDKGPIDVEANDHQMLYLDNLIPGAIYQLYVPDQQVRPGEGNRYFDYETALILATDRERKISTVGVQAIVFPNRPDVIERIITTSGGVDSDLDILEIQTAQLEMNPFTNKLSYLSSDQSKKAMLLQDSDSADLLLIMLQNPATGAQLIDSVQFDVIMGSELKYTLISVKDRVG